LDVSHDRGTIRATRSEERNDALVILDAVLRGDQLIAPAVVLEQLPAVLPEFAKVRIGGVENRCELPLARQKRLVAGSTAEIERPPIPVGIAEDEPLEV